MLSKITIATLAVLTTIAGSNAGTIHPDWGVTSYAPQMAISQTVGNWQVAGYFQRSDDACNMSLVVAVAGDEMLEVSPMRLSFAIAAADVIEFQADATNALRIACTEDAGEVKIAAFETPST